MKKRSWQPNWINSFLCFTALLFLCSVIFTIWNTHRKDSRISSAYIADFTINLTGQPVREHCTSCHPAGRLVPEDSPRGSEGKAHPDITPHLSEELGCTGCHLGEGMAVDPVVSHGLPGMGARKILAKNDVVASCYTCHELQPLQGAEKAWKGYTLFLKKGCDTCHFVDGLGMGGRYGPGLGSIGSFYGLEKIREAIKYPDKDSPNSIMPRFPLSSSQIRSISYFLKSRVENPAYITPMQKQIRRAATKNGKDLSGTGGQVLLEEKKCLACHKYRDSDGRIATDLTFISLMRTPAYILEFVRNPRNLVPGAIMPVIPMKAGEEQKLVDFLAGTPPPPINKRDAKNLYMTLCQRCHAANGNGMGIIYKNLSGLPRPFLDNKEFFMAIPDARIIHSITSGVPGTAMPPYEKILSKDEIDALVDQLFDSFIQIGRNEKKPQAPLPPRENVSFPLKNTEKLFLKNCSRCHGKTGTGTGPEYLKYLPRPRDFTNKRFFDQIGDERIARSIYDGVPGTSMPSFRSVFSGEELWNMVALIRMFSSDDGSTRKQ